MKSHISKLSLFLVVFLLFGSKLHAQEKLPVESINQEWILFKEEKGLKFYIRKENIVSNSGNPEAEYAIVKLENTLNKQLTASYSLAVSYNMGCTGCGSSEYAKTLTIPAKSSLEGNLSDGNSPLVMLLINHKLKNGWIPLYITTENLVIK
ncbi:hypothetical protein [Fluviicola sp.]|jgi:hypothetical protein|uniref:hypothetical protein n=1 Tax=Fluviicola sp. TaxID=1917219 RepID=UPI00281F961A|nr:hypothetical protein [Fluviicola sp.]MDR0801253.1 hypothetical protein [Fluviicola sp.]